MEDGVEEKARRLYAGEGLAPMVRASTTPLRVLALKYGCDFVYTEELVDRSVTATTRRVSNSHNGSTVVDYIKDNTSKSKKVLKRMEKDNITAYLLRIDPSVEKGKLICQLGTGEPELAVAAALHVHKDVDSIDVNMGCPKKFSVSGGMGSALLSDPDRACRIIRSLKDNLTEAGLPVSAKIRLLKDTSSTIDFITALINAGANAVAIHGRRVGDPPQQPADWDSLEDVVTLAKSKFPRVPILLNGDFYSRQEFQEFQDKTGANGVLLARPALYNTSIFRKPPPEQLHETYGYDSPLLLDKKTVVQDYLQEAVRYNIHYKNIKYVLCEFISNRRTPNQRVPFLPITFAQTIGDVCNCRSLQELCQLWGVQYDEKSIIRPEPAADEHRYLDSYFLNENELTTRPLKRAKGNAS